MIICQEKVERKLNRIVSVCHGEAVVVRSNTTPRVSTTELYHAVNWYECVKCGKPCDVKQQEVTE